MNQKPRVMLADMDGERRCRMKLLLSNRGVQVIEAEEPLEMLRFAGAALDLIILDAGVRGVEPQQLCKMLRRRTEAPILMTYAAEAYAEACSCTDAGASEILALPVDADRLCACARVLIGDYHALLRSRTCCTRIELGNLEIDTSRCAVCGGSAQIPLTGTEYRLLLLMATNRKQIFSVRNLYESVWKEPYFETSSNTVMVHIKNLRKKITRAGGDDRIVKTVWGKGYRIE